MISRRMLRIKVIKALYAHLKSDADSLMASEKTLVASIDKTYDLYFLMLSLIAELAHYAEQRQELARRNSCPPTKISIPIASLSRMPLCALSRRAMR